MARVKSRSIGVSFFVLMCASGVSASQECGVGYSSAMNQYNGLYSSPNVSNARVFAALKEDGSISVWGDANSGGAGAPEGSGYTSIYSNYFAFAALKEDGSISAWGGADYGGAGAPEGSGYTSIYSTGSAFAALKKDGSISAWGDATRVSGHSDKSLDSVSQI